VGGSGIVASQLGQALAQMGHEVHFICSDHPVRLDQQYPSLHFHKVDAGEYAVFQGTDYSLPLAVKIAEVSQAMALDVLHVHYAIPHAVAAILAIDMLGARKPALVTTLHGTDITLLGRDPSYRDLLNYALCRSDVLTAVSRSLKAETAVLFPELADKIEVVYNFCYQRLSQRTRAQVRHDLGIADDQVLVLHMSNLRPVKRLPWVLQTIAGARHREKLRLLVLAGGDFEPFRDQVAQLGLESQVLVHHSNEVEEYIEASDLGLYASERESFGLAILETMLGGRPVIATEVGGVAEVLGPEGHLADDVMGLIGHLDSLAGSACLRRTAGCLARERALREFPLEVALQGYLELYQQAMARGSALR
jgi:N-acetyl-alpha-D-glucosaminyl L-malate synthase BshA